VSGIAASPSEAAGPTAADFTAERQQHRRFVEGQDVLAWLEGPGRRMGKRAIVAT
jgi:hypothetical protein